MKVSDVFVGMKHGHLTVVRDLGRDSRCHKRFETLCECGEKSVLRGSHFYETRRYCTRKCKLLAEQRLLYLQGKTFGRWRVDSFSRYVGIKKRSAWHCTCSCGTKRVISGNSLVMGVSKSCGCLLRDLKRAGRTAEELIEAHRQACRVSNHKNPARVKANKIKYETKRDTATPNWLTTEDWHAMNTMYVTAKNLTKKTGVRHEVDHIIPINGKRVSGLHVPSNLQILTQAKNVSKSNIYAELLGD